MTDFSAFGLAPQLLQALTASGYTTPTPIQTQAIPLALEGRDVIGLAQTGTGKTAAFALPILHRLAADRRPTPAKSCRALVLAPTRELAAQIKESFRTYGANMGLSSTVIFGGVPMGRQKDAMLRGIDVLVATPGRLLDLVGQRAIRLDAVEYLVLDEADHMLDIGFIHALREIAQKVPKQRQTLFFSATMPKEIAELADRFLTDPARVAVAPAATTAERVEQVVVHVENAKKPQVLSDILAGPEVTRAVVFTRTKHGADRVVRRLLATGVVAEAIHGNKSQGQRERALAAFKYGKARVLVATEIAARGLDIDDVSHVVNFDLPNVPEQYVHRIGRTARAGASGLAISLCAPDERSYLKDIERTTRQPIPVLEHPMSLPTPAPDARVPPPPKQGRGGGGGGGRGGRPPYQRQAERQPGEGRARDERPRQDGPREDRQPRAERREEQPRSHAPRGQSPRGQAPAGAPRDGRGPDDRRPKSDARGRPDARSDDRAGGDRGERRRGGGEEIWSNQAAAPRRGPGRSGGGNGRKR
ncbi:MAG: DEAD/DEAH box helicase [Alphaproteobacteria bacterium]|nr:DEAD/DEAH box helicase [Alphaproteobacteria bacterium]